MIWFLVGLIQWARVINDASVRFPQLLAPANSVGLRSEHVTYLLLEFVWCTVVVLAATVVLLRHWLTRAAVVTVCGVTLCSVFVRGLVPLEILLWLVVMGPFLVFFEKNKTYYRSANARARVILFALLLCCCLTAGLTVAVNYHSATRQYVLAGELFDTKLSTVMRAPGARIYAIPMVHTNENDFWQEVESLEAGARLKNIDVTTAVGRASCFLALVALLRHYSGLSHPYDPKFAEIEQEWQEITRDPDWPKLSEVKRKQISDTYWRKTVLKEHGFEQLSEQDRNRFHAWLFTGVSSQASLVARLRSADATTDLDGRFSLNLAAGGYLILAEGKLVGADSKFALPCIWVKPIRVVGPGKIVLAETQCCWSPL